MPEDKGKLANDSSLPYIQPGALNPIGAPSDSPVIDTSKNIAGINYIARTIVDSFSRSATANLTRYKGIVLRENIKNNGKEEENTTDGWFEKLKSLLPTGKVEGSFRNYTIYVPDVHSHLPTVTQSFISNLQNGVNVEQRKIDLYPEFISKDSSVEPATPGQAVWVTFGNLQTFEDGIYLGPVISTGAEGAQGHPSSDITGAQEAFGNCTPTGGLQAKPPTGEPVGGTSTAEGSKEETEQQVGEGENKTDLSRTSTAENCISSFSTTDQLAGIGELTEPYPLTKPKSKLVKVKGVTPLRIGTAAGKGASQKELREDAAFDMEQVASILTELGAVLTTVGATEQLSRPGGANRAVASFHKVGTAWDLYTWGGSPHPSSKSREGFFDYEYFVTKSSESTGKRLLFDVWARSDKPVGTQWTDPKTGTTFTVERKELDVVVCRTGKRNQGPGTEKATVNVVPLTAIMKAYGFVRIPARKSYFTKCGGGNAEKASEWWHFQSHRQFVEGKTTFGEATRIIRPDEEVAAKVSDKDQRRVFRNISFARR